MHINNNFTKYDFGSMLSQYNYNLHPGDIIAGTIFSQECKGFLVDIGANIAGYLPIEEVSLSTKIQNYSIKYLNNETREFFIIAYNKQLKQLLLSIKRLEYIRAWKRIKQLENENITLYLNKSDINKGGILTVVEGLQGFIPNSHISKQIYKDQCITCKILLADEKINKLILSNKKAILDNFNKRFKIGDMVNGQIIKIEPYGVFIQINGIPALLHISEIGYKKIEDIHKIFNIGDYIQVKIIHIDIERARLSVSRRNMNLIPINHHPQQ